MKSYSVRITRQAREHLRGIKSYIANELLCPRGCRKCDSWSEKGNKEPVNYAGENQTYGRRTVAQSGYPSNESENYYVYLD